MTSTNNLVMRRQQLGEQKPVYGLRKLSMGFGSVLLGTMLYAGTSPAIHADVLPTGEQNAMNSNSSATNESTNPSSSPTSSVNTASTVEEQPVTSATATSVASPVSQSVANNMAAESSSPVVNEPAIGSQAPVSPASQANNGLVSSNNGTVNNQTSNPALTINVPTSQSQPTVASSANKLPDFTMVIGAKRGQTGYQISTHPDQVLDNYAVAKSDNNGGYQVGVKPTGNYAGMLTIPNLADVQGRYLDASRVSFNLNSLKQANLNAVTGLSFSGTNGQKVMLVGSLKRALANLRNLRSLDFTNADTSLVTDLSNSMSDLPLLQTVNLAGSDFSKVTRADQMFANDRALQLVTGLNGVDFSNLQSANEMFANTPNLENVDLTGVQFSDQLKSVAGMFDRSGVKTINFANANLNGVTDFSRAFANTSDLQQINGLHADQVENMAHIFDGSHLSTVDMSMFNGQHVKNLDSALANMPNLTKVDGLSAFAAENNGQIENMHGFVQNDTKLQQLALNGFYRTDKLTDLSHAFNNTGLKVLDLSAINPSNVKTMHKMASDNADLTLVMLGNQFKADQVNDLNQTFANNPKLASFDLASFKTGANVDANKMFAGDHGLKSLTNLDGIQADKDQMLAGLNQSLVQNIKQYDQSLVASHHSKTWTRTIHITIHNGTTSYTIDVPQSAHADWDDGAFSKATRLPDLRLSDYQDQFESHGIHLTPEELQIVIPGVNVTPETPATLPDVYKTYGDGTPVSMTKQIQLIDDDWVSGMTDKQGHPLNKITKVLNYTLKDISDDVPANVEAQVPAGYTIVPGGRYPKDITMLSADIQQVHIKHIVTDSSASSETFTRTYEGVDDSDNGKQIFYRTVMVKVPVTGAGTDEVTGKTVDGQFEEGRYSFQPYNPATDTTVNSDGSVIADVIKKYQLANGSSTVPGESITSSSSQEKTYVIHYVSSQPAAGDKLVSVTFVDDDWTSGMTDTNGKALPKNPGSYSLTIKKGDHNVPLNLKEHIPSGYEPTPGHLFPTEVDGSTPAYTVHLRHKKSELPKQTITYTRTINGVDQKTGAKIYTYDQRASIDYTGLRDDVTGKLDPMSFPANLQFAKFDPTANEQTATAIANGKFKWVSGSADVQTITADSPTNQTVTIYYLSTDTEPVTPTQKNAIHIQFIDLDRNNEVAGAQVLANLKVGGQLDLEQYYEGTYANKYVLDSQQNRLAANGDLQPYQVTDAAEQVVKVYLRHKTSISSEDRTIHRRIYLAQADGTKKLLEDQTIDASRDVTTDLVDGAKTYGDWSDVDFPEYDVNSSLLVNDEGQPITESQVPEEDYDTDQINKLVADNGIYHVDDVVLSYGDDDGNVTASIVFKTKDGEIIDDSGAEVTGKPGQKVDLTQQSINVPEGYELDPGQSMTITLGNATGEVDILIHAIVKDVTNDPAYADRLDPVAMTLTRTIQFLDRETSNKLKDDVVQKVRFTRHAYYNGGTDEITYSAWKFDGSGSTDSNKAQFDGMSIPSIAGYTPEAGQKIDPVVVNDVNDLSEAVPSVQIYYQSNKDSQAISETVNYKTSDGQLVGSQVITGKVGQTVALDNIPSGYHLVNKADAQLKLTNNGQSVDVQVAADKPAVQTVTETFNYKTADGKTVGGQIVTGKLGQTVTLDKIPTGYHLANGRDAQQTLTDDGATVDIQVAADNDQPEQQEVMGTVNYVDQTGKVLKTGSVKALPNQSFDVTSQVALPAGYVLADASAKNVQLTAKGNNVFNITVQPEHQVPSKETVSGVVDYVTASGNVVGTGTISGKPGESFNVTSQVKVPDGYVLVNAGDANVTLTKDHQVVKVLVKQENSEATMQGTIFFIDHDTNQLVDTALVKGHAGESVDISKQVPDDYRLTNAKDSHLTLVEGKSQYQIEVTRVAAPNPDAGVIYLQFKDGKQNVGASIELKGNIGDLIDWTKQASIPKGYELVNPNDQLPVQIMRKMQIITINLKHKLQANPVQTIQRNLIFDLYAGDSVQPFAAVTKTATGQVTTYTDMVTGQPSGNAKIVWSGGNVSAGDLPVPANYHLMTKLDGITSSWLPTDAENTGLQALTKDAHIKVYFAVDDPQPAHSEHAVKVGLKAIDQEPADTAIEQKLHDQIASAFNGVLKPYNVSKDHPMSQLISQLKTALTLQAVQERLKDVVPSIDATDIQIKQTADNQLTLELAFKHHHTQNVEHMTANELIMFVDQAGNDLGHTISASLPLTVTTDKDEVTGQTKTSSLVAEDGSFKSYDVQDLVNKLFAGYQPIGLTANYGQVNGKFVISPIDNSDGMINSFVPDADHLNTIVKVTLAKKAAPDQPDVTKKVDKKIIFVDDQGNSVGQPVEISGKAGTSQDVIYQVPAGYYVANGAKGMTVHFDHDEVIKVLVKKTVQTASWSLSFVDTQTGKVVGSAIVKGPMNSQQSLNGLVPAGYELVNNSDNNFVLNKLTNNWQVKVQKKVVPQVISRNIVYLAPDGKIVGRQAVSGETGSTQTVTLEVPKGYKYDQSTIDLKLDSTADYMLMVSADSKPTNPDQPNKPGQSDQITNPTNPTNPKRPDQSGDSNNKPDQPTNPTNPAKPTNSDQPNKPGQSDQITNPTNPTNPERLDQSGKPNNKPDQPTNPTNPDQPNKPVNPNNKPDQPTKPTNPTKPAEPTYPDVNPDQPNKPDQSGKPNTKPGKQVDENSNQTPNLNPNSNRVENDNATSSKVAQHAEQSASVDTANNGENRVANMQSASYRPTVNASAGTNAGQAAVSRTGNIAGNAGVSGDVQPAVGAAKTNNAGLLPQTGQQNAGALAALGAFTAMFGLGLLKKKRED